MTGSLPVRDEHFDLLAQELLTGVAEEALCGAIDQFDPSGAIDQQESARRNFDDEAKKINHALTIVVSRSIGRNHPERGDVSLVNQPRSLR
jgi:hypothetical protein